VWPETTDNWAFIEESAASSPLPVKPFIAAPKLREAELRTAEGTDAWGLSEGGAGQEATI